MSVAGMTDGEVLAKVREMCEAAADTWSGKNEQHIADSLEFLHQRREWVAFIADPERGKLILDLLVAMELYTRRMGGPERAMAKARYDAVMDSMREGIKK